MVTPSGFEPELSGPKPLVLPLHHGVINGVYFSTEFKNFQSKNKKLLKNRVQNGILVGYHLETQIKPEQKNFKRFFKTVEFYPSEIPNQ